MATNPQALLKPALYVDPSSADIDVGTQLARAAFATRGNHTEIHLSEVMLAALLAVATAHGRTAAGDL
jgi:hypothetical protein